MKRARSLALLIPVVCALSCADEHPGSDPTTTPSPRASSSAAFTTPLATDRIPTSKGTLVVSPLEHASVLLGWDGLAIYVDPTTPAIADEALPLADLVFVTEARFDHLDAVALPRLARPGTIVVGPPEVAEKTHVDVVLRNGETRSVRGIDVTAVPMYNAERGAAPGLRFHDKGRGNGYVLDFAGTRVYLSGDTECTPELRALERIDVAFVSVSAPKTMTPGEAVTCIEAFRPKVVFPYHDRHVDLSDLRTSLAGTGVDLRERDFYPRARKLRDQALGLCAKGRWGMCREFLDAAQTLDPEGEDDARVTTARQQIRDWQSPFPSWW